MDLFAEYTDPRLVELYDIACPLGQDSEFYLELAGEHAGSSIIDLGCGTGLLTCELARRGHRMIGIDPSPVMLSIARRRPGGDRVRWVVGDADGLTGAGADLVIMTGHVAQVIADDAAWSATLAAARENLRPGGRIAFESRDPRAQVWAAGEIYGSRRHFDDPEVGSFDLWQQNVEKDGELVRYELHYLLADGTELVSRNELRFRTQQALSAALTHAGFAVEHVFGDWDRRPVGDTTPELIFMAERG